MQYSKLPISIDEQIAKLKQRKLSFDDEERAKHYLSHISYYRLRAYTYPFQDNTDPEHPFVKPVSFEQIIRLYVFDRHLRLLIFNAIEKIEIALRTQIVYHYAMEHGSHWHLKPELYTNTDYLEEHLSSLHKEVKRSKETFINHYRDTYADPQEPASWMSLEVTSMGLLSKIFKNLRKDTVKDQITRHFGLKDADLLDNWIYCLSILRNTCAHHGRIWNRRLPVISLPKKSLNPYIINKNFNRYKIYAYVCDIVYLLNIISPHHNFKSNFIRLMDNCPLSQEKEMGFLESWREEVFWR